MANIQIGIVGSGNMSSRRAGKLSEQDDVTIRTIAARNPQTGPQLAAQFDARHTTNWQDLLSDSEIDALFVGTHNEIHGAIVMAALEAGKHVFTEYPVSRYPDEARQIERLIAGPASPVLRVSNNESISAEHAALKTQVGKMGHLLATHFVRLTPGRGQRPEVLFNLKLSGPPALFFVYHLHTYVSLFGPASRVHCSAEYEGLNTNSGYYRFANCLTVGFASGGTGQWTWAGGIEIESATQEACIVMSEGTLIETDTAWDISLRSGRTELSFGENERSLEARFVEDIQSSTDWRKDTLVALASDAIGHAAEISAAESRAVNISEVT